MDGPSMHRVLNLDTYGALQAAGMTDSQAKILAVAIPDWSQFATQQDLAELRAELERRLNTQT